MGNMRLVFDLTLCGELGDVYFADHCPDIAAQMSCEDYVRRMPGNLTEAYWSIHAFDVYQQHPLRVENAVIRSSKTDERHEEQQKDPLDKWTGSEINAPMALSANDESSKAKGKEEEHKRAS